MQKGFSRKNTGFVPEYDAFSGKPDETNFRRRKVWMKGNVNLSDEFIRNPLNSTGDSTMVSGSSKDHHMLFSLNRKDYFSRKDAARKNLMGYLYSRQPTITRSYSFIAGEKPNSDAFFPKLQTISKEKPTADVSGPEVRITSKTSKEFIGKKPHKNANIMDGNTVESKRNNDRLDYIEGKGAMKRKESLSRRLPLSAPLSRQETNKFSLPDLINDLNKEVARNKSSPVFSDESDNEKHESEDKVVQMIGKHITKGGKLYPCRHRPITPGLLDKLNKLKQPTRSRTGQWVLTLPSETRAYIGESRINSYKSTDTEVLSDDKSWIYEEV